MRLLCIIPENKWGGIVTRVAARGPVFGETVTAIGEQKFPHLSVETWLLAEYPDKCGYDKSRFIPLTGEKEEIEQTEERFAISNRRFYRMDIDPNTIIQP